MDESEWTERLIAELKALSTSTWGSGKRAFGAMPAAIERAIKKQSGRIGPKLHRPYYEQAKQQIDQLILEGDKYADTLRVASDHLSFLLQRI